MPRTRIISRSKPQSDSSVKGHTNSGETKTNGYKDSNVSSSYSSNGAFNRLSCRYSYLESSDNIYDGTRQNNIQCNGTESSRKTSKSLKSTKYKYEETPKLDTGDYCVQTDRLHPKDKYESNVYIHPRRRVDQRAMHNSLSCDDPSLQNLVTQNVDVLPSGENPTDSSVVERNSRILFDSNDNLSPTEDGDHHVFNDEFENATVKKRKRKPRRRNKKPTPFKSIETEPLGDCFTLSGLQLELEEHCGCGDGIAERTDSGVDVQSQSSSISGVSKDSSSPSSRSPSGTRASPLLMEVDPETIPYYFKEPDVEDYQNPYEETGLTFSDDEANNDHDGDSDSISSWSQCQIDENAFGDKINAIDNDHEEINFTLMNDVGSIAPGENNNDEFVSDIRVVDNTTSLIHYGCSPRRPPSPVIPIYTLPWLPKEGESEGDDDGDTGDDINNDANDGNDDGNQEDKTDELENDPLVEIDYDSYLPAAVLMHVKRDLVSILMEYGQTREVKVAFDEMDRYGPHHASRFFTSAVVDGETFPLGCGSSKKNAKKAAAAFALRIMYERGRQNLNMVNEMAHRKIGIKDSNDHESRAHKVVLVSRHVLEVCQETQFINYSKEKIVATFVLEFNGKMKVVGLGTGNRCILFPNLTKDGKRIIHAHAEIVARRAFLRYLYKQLLLFNKSRSHPIFTRSDSGKLKLRDRIQVHLYISRPPCGDAAAFPTISNFPNKMRAVRKQGQLRTIIDDGEGAIPTEFHVPTGANGKERLRIMTCSDKILRWNALGVQGALLSHFIDPIYINSLVIGSHTGDQRGHLPRAISGRLKCGRLHEVMQRPYRINSPDIQYPHNDLSDIYSITKSKQYFITWSYGDEDAEVVDAITGVTNMEPMDEPMSSRICKLSLYSLFLQLCQKFGRRDLLAMDYHKAKRSATTFQRMKSFVGQHLGAMGFGHWYSLQETYGTDDFSNCPTWC